MVNWRDRILEKFLPNVARLTLVADPDSLLPEADISQEIQARGFEILSYEDAISFRFIYESRYRSQHQRKNLSYLVVLVHSQSSDLQLLPYDLLQESDRTLSFGLRELFPKLSYVVLNALDRNLLDAVDEALIDQQPNNLNDIETQDFILRHVFRIAPESIKQDSDLLNCLLRLHYKEQHLPEVLSTRLIAILQQKSQFQGYPLETIVPDRSAFLKFLQENWSRFALQQILQSSTFVSTVDSSPSYGNFSVINLPFGHKDVWAYMDNLFREGYLKPVSPQSLGFLDFKPRSEDWFRIGLYIDEISDQKYRFKKLLELIHETLPTVDAPYRDWFSFAYRWSELLVLWQQIGNAEEPTLTSAFSNLQERIDTAFLDWVLERYNTLHYQSPAHPAMLHHVAFFMARQVNLRNKQKIALVLIDGLALDQWLIVRRELSQQKAQWQFQEEALFALIPTITSVSRQAAFAGKPPIGFPNSIHVTSKEPALWQQFWIDRGFTAQQIAYTSGLRDQHHLERVEELASHPAIRVLGLVVDKIDRISHSKESGTPGMHEQIRPWVRQGFLTSLLDSLVENGFKVFITADHGNIAAVGIGRPSEGAAAEYRGERVRIYTESSLRTKVKEKFPAAIAWDSPTLPPNYLPLLAPNRQAFVTKGEEVVAHGGISMEELIVPFIQIRQ